MAVSHAVEGKSGGSKPLEGNCTPIHMVGGTPTVQEKLGCVDMLCKVDSGSMMSFVTEDLHRKKLQPTCGRMKRREQMLNLCAANWLEIPYMGYLELETEVDGVIILKKHSSYFPTKKGCLDPLGPMFWYRSPSLVPCFDNGPIVGPGRVSTSK